MTAPGNVTISGIASPNGKFNSSYQSGSSFTPDILVDFNGLTNGQSVVNTANDPGSVAGKRFDSVPGNIGYKAGYGVRAVTGVKYPGDTSSCEMSIALGSDGDPSGGDTGTPYGAFGGMVNVPAGLTQGSEMWWGQWMFFPSTWKWGSVTPQSEIKFMRIDHNDSSAHLDIYVLNGRYSYYGNGDSSAVGVDIQSGFYWTCEWDPNASEPYTKMTSTGIPLNQWVWVEQYVYGHSDPLQAKRRMWIDGVFVREQVGNAVKWRANTGVIKTGTLPGGQKTLQSSTDTYTQVRNCTYWNNYSIQNQSCNIRCIVIHKTMATLPSTDEFGNKMMGKYKP